MAGWISTKNSAADSLRTSSSSHAAWSAADAACLRSPRPRRAGARSRPVSVIRRRRGRLSHGGQGRRPCPRRRGDRIATVPCCGAYVASWHFACIGRGPVTAESRGRTGWRATVYADRPERAPETIRKPPRRKALRGLSCFQRGRGRESWGTHGFRVLRGTSWWSGWRRPPSRPRC
jgi:hypothetical protein